jgi:hypothetical protein
MQFSAAGTAELRVRRVGVFAVRALNKGLMNLQGDRCFFADDNPF